MSWQLVLADLWLRLSEKPRLAREADVSRARARAEALAALVPLPRAFRRRETPLWDGGRVVPALRLEAAADGPLLVWFHGGAFCLGSPRTHASLAAALAERIGSGAGAVLPAYRLAPEHPFPAAAADALSAYRALLAEGVDPRRVVVGGDSAGGGLALGLLHRLLALGLPRPAAVLAFSPWVDMTLAGASLVTRAAEDAYLPAARLPEVRDAYLAGADPRDPLASPWLGQFTGAPPVLIQASRAEILLDDARAMAATLARDGVAVGLDLWDRTPHAWQLYHAGLPEAATALDRAAAFAVQALAAGSEG